MFCVVLTGKGARKKKVPPLEKHDRTDIKKGRFEPGNLTKRGYIPILSRTFAPGT
jgi:hypothetical protein